MTTQMAYSPKQLERLLEGIIGRTKLYDMLQTGEIKSVRLGRKYLIPAREIQRLLGEGKVPEAHQ